MVMTSILADIFPPVSCPACSGSTCRVLHVEHDGGSRAGAADEHFPVGGRFERIRGVADVAGQQRCDAGVADPGATAPAGGDVAGLGEFEDAALTVGERGGYPAA